MEKILNLAESHLSNRKQGVAMNGSESEWCIVDADSEEGIKYVKFFAAGTSLFSIVGNPNTTANDLNHGLKLINQWKMRFTPAQLIFSRKGKKEGMR